MARLFSPDASEVQRAQFSKLCKQLDFDVAKSLTPEPNDIQGHQIRGGDPDRATVNELVRKMGLTRNAVMLTAFRMGLAAMVEVHTELGDD